MNILITGGAGNLGSSLAKMLASKSENTVVVADKFLTGKSINLPKDNPNLKLIAADSNSMQEMSNIFQKFNFDLVFHYAAVVGVERTLNDPIAVLNDIDGISCKVPEGGFYAWADISSFGLSSEEFSKRLIEDAKVAVIPGASFGDVGEFYIRVTCVKSWEEVKSGMQQIQKFVKKLNTK